MTGAGLPPIALEAVLKLLAIGQDSALTRKPTKPAGTKPKLQLGLVMPTASAFTPARAGTGSARKPQRKSGARGAAHPYPLAEGTKSC